MKRMSLKRLPRWVPPASTALVLVVAIVAVIVSLNAIRRIIDEAVTKPVDEEAKRNFPVIDTENLNRLKPRLPAPFDQSDGGTVSETDGESDNAPDTP